MPITLTLTLTLTACCTPSLPAAAQMPFLLLPPHRNLPSSPVQWPMQSCPVDAAPPPPPSATLPFTQHPLMHSTPLCTAPPYAQHPLMSPGYDKTATPGPNHDPNPGSNPDPGMRGLRAYLRPRRGRMDVRGCHQSPGAAGFRSRVRVRVWWV